MMSGDLSPPHISSAALALAASAFFFCGDAMSTELVQGEVGLRPVTGSSLQEIMTLGRVFKASGYFKDVRDEAQAVTKILYGRELGFTPIVSIMGIYIIDGKPSLASNLLATLV